MVNILEQGERVHIVEHRRFDRDVRRHFVGEIETASNTLIRVNGFLFVFDPGSASFSRSEDRRTRIFRVDNLIAITVLPREVALDELSYRRDDKGLAISDGAGVRLYIGAFGPHG